jgi:hypothetical protein
MKMGKDVARRSAESLVDEFVAYVNSSGLEPKFPNELPEELRGGKTDYGMFEWQIRLSADNPWIPPFLQRLPQVLPAPFLSLIERYRFVEFEVGPIMFFANTGQALFNELATSVFRDKGLFPVLHRNGYLEFGKRSGGWYDPMCFDMKKRGQDDAPIVHLDHEEILINNRIKVLNEIAPSFCDFLRRAISSKLEVS